MKQTERTIDSPSGVQSFITVSSPASHLSAAQSSPYSHQSSTAIANTTVMRRTDHSTVRTGPLSQFIPFSPLLITFLVVCHSVHQLRFCVFLHMTETFLHCLWLTSLGVSNNHLMLVRHSNVGLHPSGGWTESTGLDHNFFSLYAIFGDGHLDCPHVRGAEQRWRHFFKYFHILL